LIEVLPAVHLDREAGQRIVNGLLVSHVVSAPGLVRLYDANDAFLGVGEIRADATLVSKRLVSTVPMARTNQSALD
jgi:hypothetical protein